MTNADPMMNNTEITNRAITQYNVITEGKWWLSQKHNWAEKSTIISCYIENWTIFVHTIISVAKSLNVM